MLRCVSRSLEQMTIVLEIHWHSRRRFQLDSAPAATIEIIDQLAKEGVWIVYRHKVGQDRPLQPQCCLKIHLVDSPCFSPDSPIHHVRALFPQLAQAKHQILASLLPVHVLLPEDSAHAKELLLLLAEATAETNRDEARRIQELQLCVPEATDLVPRETFGQARPAIPRCNFATSQAVDDRRLANVGETNHHSSNGSRIDSLSLAPPVDVGTGLQQLLSQLLNTEGAQQAVDSHDRRAAVAVALLYIADCLLKCCRWHQVCLAQDDHAWPRLGPFWHIWMCRRPWYPCIPHLNDHVHSLHVLQLHITDGHCLVPRPPVQGDIFA
mmetsp:Transcript_29039/g.69144  ORF Transcript_29039/g.69144 Transcript_29039/m.69144 type:complete len:324 (+) Transcript_29039:192-1163(+)